MYTYVPNSGAEFLNCWAWTLTHLCKKSFATANLRFNARLSFPDLSFLSAAFIDAIGGFLASALHVLRSSTARGHVEMARRSAPHWDKENDKAIIVHATDYFVPSSLHSSPKARTGNECLEISRLKASAQGMPSLRSAGDSTTG